MRECERFERFLDAFERDTSMLFESHYIQESEAGEGWETFTVRVSESEFTVTHRRTETVREFMLRSALPNTQLVRVLEMIGLGWLSKIMGKWGYVARSVTVSYVIPSESVYLLIEGIKGRVPTVRVSVRRDNYEASASYCVISDGENVCAYLKELIDEVSKLRECIINRIQ